MTKQRRFPLRHRALEALLAATLALGAASAWAEKADREKPVNLEADTVTVNDATGISIYQGNVVLSQGTLVIKGDKIVVKQGQGGFEHGTVYGRPASFKQKREASDEYIYGYADRIEYDAKSDTAQLFDHAIMRRGKDEVRGNYISYDANTEFFQAQGGPAAEGASGGRVRAVIQPKPKPSTDTPAGGPATPKPATP